jgi:hypothetical protein
MSDNVPLRTLLRGVGGVGGVVIIPEGLKFSLGRRMGLVQIC